MANEITQAGIRLTGDASGLNAAWQQAEQGAKKVADAAEHVGAAVSSAAQEGTQALMTWHQFIGQRMGPLMRQFSAEGVAHAEAHTRAIRQISQEWQTYKSTGVAAHQAVAQGSASAAASAAKVAAATKLTKQEILALNYTASDIAASLASGASPFTILLQQGGQVKDSFGGIGPMFQKLGQFINPVTVGIGIAAATVGTLATAWYQGREEAKQFTDSMRLTGNYAGITATQYEELAAKVTAATNTTAGQGREVMQALVSTGQFSGKALVDVGTAVVNVQKLTGQATDEIVADFASMTSGVTKWAEEHNKRYHFLSAAQWEYIKNLEEQGRAQDAQKVVLDALNTSMAKSQETLGFFPKLFQDASKAASDFWSWLKKIGAPETTEDIAKGLEGRLAAVQAQLAAARGGKSGITTSDAGKSFSISGTQVSSSVSGLEEEERALNERIIALRQAAGFKQAAVQADADNARISQAGITAAKEYEIQRRSADKKYALAQELAAYDRRVAAMRAANMDSAPSAAQEALDKAAIRDKYKAPVDHAALKAAEDRYRARIASQEGLQRLEQDQLKAHLDHLDALRRQGAASEEQVIAQRLAAQQAAIDNLIAISNREAAIAEKAGKKGDAEKYREEVKRLEAQRADLERQASDDSATLTISRTRALQDWIVAERDAIEQQAFEMSLIGKTASEVERLTNARRIDLAVRNATRNSDGSLKVDAATAGGYEQAGAYAKSQFKGKEAWREGDWTDGAKKALEEYGATAQTVAETSRDAFLSMANGSTNALMNFVTTGKFNMKSFARSVIGDLAAIYTKQIMVWLIGKAIGMFAGTQVGAATDIPMQAGGGYAKGAAFGPQGVHPFASGTILDRPTNFLFSNGGQMSRGLAGESGDEGILPLARMRNGKLGVSSDGGGGVVVNVYASEGTKATTKQSKQGDQTIIDVLLEKVDDYLAGNAATGAGSLTAALESSYGLNRAAASAG